MSAVRWVLAVSVVIVVAVAWRALAMVPGESRVSVDEMAIVAGAALVAALGGLAIWELRPDRSSGPLAAAAGIGATACVLTGYLPVGVFTVGVIVWACTPLLTAHLLLTHPDGLDRRWRVPVVVTCWVIPSVLGLTMLAFADTWQPARLVPYGRWLLRSSPIALDDRPGLAQALAVAHAAWVAAVAVASSLVVLHRRHHADGGVRQSIGPLAWTAPVWALTMIGAGVFTVRGLRGRLSADATVLPGTFGIVLPAVGVALVVGSMFWADVLRPRLDPARDGRIVLTGEALPDGDTLRRRLGRAVGDPSLRLALRSPEGTWLTPAGERTELRDDRERAITTITRGGVLIAAIEHDRSLRATPDIVAVATTMFGLAIDNVRLTALDASQLQEIRDSGAALLAATERGRQRIARTIADGPATRLADLARRAGEGEDSIALQRALREVASDVRTISHGVYPPELERSGLSAALDDAVGVPARRYPPAIELTAFLAAAGRPGARLQQVGDQLAIEVAGFVGDEAAARVHALDGTICDDRGTSTITIPVPD